MTKSPIQFPKILMVGDRHGNSKDLNTLINRKNPDIVIQVGDFGYFPDAEEKYTSSSYKHGETTVLFIDGNHEDHDALDRLGAPLDPPKLTIHKHFYTRTIGADSILPVAENTYYVKRNTVVTLIESGRNILFLGGAESIDKNQRTAGIDWFPQEGISNKNIWELPDIKIDIIVSHTCPSSFFPQLENKFDPNSSEIALDLVLEKYQPDLWYFGHFHRYKKGKYNNTHWTCLNRDGNTGFWETLPEW